MSGLIWRSGVKIESKSKRFPIMNYSSTVKTEIKFVYRKQNNYLSIRNNEIFIQDLHKVISSHLKFSRKFQIKSFRLNYEDINTRHQ